MTRVRRVSRAGGTGALGAVLALVGGAFASPSLAVAGLGLVAVAAGAVIWVELAAARASLRVEPGPRRIVEGDTYSLLVHLDRGIVPLPGGELSDPLLAEPVGTGPLRPGRIQAELRMKRRGRHVLEGTAWEISDPFGLHARRLVAPPAGELLVLPRLEPVEAMGPAAVEGRGASASSAGDEGISSVREARAVEFEVDGLRPYRHGSPASRIHWPAVARSGEMHERRIVAGAEATPLVALDAEDPLDDDALDRAVRAAASLCVHLAPRSGCAVLLPGARTPAALDSRLRGWPALHARFATVGSEAPTRLPRDWSGSRGSVFWVTARAAGASALPRGARAARNYVVSTSHLGGPVAFQVAGCFGVATSARAARRTAA